MSTHNPIKVSLSELNLGLSRDQLEDAFGSDALGILLVDGLPLEYNSLRRRVLNHISTLAKWPEQDLAELECEEAFWLTGWSRGKEKLASTGEADYNKGSFYVNCSFHVDPALEQPPTNIVEKFPDFKSYVLPNIWPSESKMPLFETDVKKLCNMIIDIAEIVAKNCDQYIQASFPDVEGGFVQRIVADSSCTKARLLHYYPMIEKKTEKNDNWCGEHVDHSCLTGLVSAVYYDESEDLLKPLPRSPDKNAGLFIKNRRGETIKVDIPDDCLAFQSGSALQEISKEKFKAVPHYVTGPSSCQISRSTLAVFCQPNLDEQVNSLENFAQYASRILKENH